MTTRNTTTKRIDNIVDQQLTCQLTTLLRPVGLKRFKAFVDWLKSLGKYDNSEETIELESVPEYLTLMLKHRHFMTG